MMRNSASTMLCWFSLPIRTMRVGLPLSGAMTIEMLNRKRTTRPATGEQEHARHDLNRADNVTINRLRIHVAVADRRQRLHAEEKTIEKPFRRRCASDAPGIETVKERKEKVQPDVNSRDKRGELRPA